MMGEKIYKTAIKKELEKVYNLGGDKLIKEQEKLVKIIEKIFSKWYKLVLEELSKNEEIKINDTLNAEIVEKYADESDLEKVAKKLEKGFGIGVKQLDSAFKKDPKVDVTFGLVNDDAVNYAIEKGSKLITGIDDYTKSRIGKLVEKGVEKGWGYNKIAKELKKDYAFSSYRANLIASNELGNAYLHGKDEQFHKYRKEFGVDGYKNWISHRDMHTTEGCLHNDMQGWIPYSENFDYGDIEKPTRFPGCRCNIVYNIFNPEEERLTKDNAEPHEEAQAIIGEDKGFNEGIKPKNFNTYTTEIIPASFFNEIGESSEYISKGNRGYYNPITNTINLGLKGKTEYQKIQTETHEVGHFFFEKKVLKDKQILNNFHTLYKEAVDELETYIEVSIYKDAITKKYGIEKYLDINYTEIFKNYKIKILEGGIYVSNNDIDFIMDKANFLSIIQNISKDEYGFGHEKDYYESYILEKGKIDITYKQAHELFAQLNTTHFLGNNILKAMLPSTYKNMKNFYKENFNLDFNE